MGTRTAAKPSADLKFQKPSVTCLLAFYNNNLLTGKVVNAKANKQCIVLGLKLNKRKFI